MEYIGREREIYAGHFVEMLQWPRSERVNPHAEQFVEAQKFVASLANSQPGAVASSQKASKKQRPDHGPCSSPSAKGARSRSTSRTLPSQTGSQRDSRPAATNDLPSEAEADWGDPPESSADDTSEAWSDEDAHAAWNKLSTHERVTMVKSIKRMQRWQVRQEENAMDDEVQPGVELDEDIVNFLRDNNLRHVSPTAAINDMDPSGGEIGKGSN